MDLVTEGVLTLNRTLNLLKTYVEEDIDENFFIELDRDNGGSQLAKMIIERRQLDMKGLWQYHANLE